MIPLGQRQQTALTVHPELWGLLARRLEGWVFEELPDHEPPLLAGGVMWPGGWSDAIAVAGETDARAYRCDPAGETLWHRDGTLNYVLEQLAELPAPWARLAPRLVLPGRVMPLPTTRRRRRILLPTPRKPAHAI